MVELQARGLGVPLESVKIPQACMPSAPAESLPRDCGLERERPEGVTMRRNAIGAGRALLQDENGQTMLEYIIIIIFSIIVTIVFFRLIHRIVHSTTDRVSASFDTD
jgi:hypothetical protein